jgi:hypothetical protein
MEIPELFANSEIVWFGPPQFHVNPGFEGIGSAQELIIEFENGVQKFEVSK